MSDIIHVLLADDHELVRSGLKSVLHGIPEFSVVAEARDGYEAVREAKRLRPELAVLDVRMPRLNGIAACRQIRSEVPECHALMLTSYTDKSAVMAAIVAGASGFMLKEIQTDRLLESMRIIGRGGTTLDPVAAAAVIDEIRKGQVVSAEDRLADKLSARDLEVLGLIADGLTNREIGEHMYLSEKTVKHHVSDILAILGVHGRVDAARFSIRRAAQHTARN